MLNSLQMVKFKDMSRSLSVFQVLSRQILFSRTFQDSPVYSSTFQACVKPVWDSSLFIFKGSLVKLSNHDVFMSIKIDLS